MKTLIPTKEVVNTETQKEYDKLMKLCETAGWTWRNTTNPATSKNNWPINKENTCIKMTPPGKEHQKTVTLSFADKVHYKNEGIKSITFQDFLKAQIPIATSDIEKENNILTSINSLRYVEIFAKNLQKNLSPEIHETLTLKSEEKMIALLQFYNLDPLKENPTVSEKLKKGILSIIEEDIKEQRKRLKKLARDYGKEKRKVKKTPMKKKK